MIAYDIQAEAWDVYGRSNDAVTLRKLTRAIRLLSQKGNWDPLLGYLTLPVSASGDIILPADVAEPLRVNVNNRPASFQDAYYEFDIARPGEEGAQLSWTFGRLLTTPLQVPWVVPSRLRVSAGAPPLLVTGINDATGEMVESVNLGVTYGAPVWRSIHQISKAVGEPNTYLDLHSETDQGNGADARVARYHWRDRSPEFRVIRLDGPGPRPDTIRLIYRRRSYDLVTWQDYIPLASQDAIIEMLRAVYHLDRDGIQLSEEHQRKALEFLADEQAARAAASKEAEGEGQRTSASNWNARFGGLVCCGEVYDDAAEIFPGYGRERLFDKISEGVETLARRNNWDSMIGYADIVTAPLLNGSRVFALPAWCDAVLAVNVCGVPGFARTRAIEFHINGPGGPNTAGLITTPIGAWDYMEDGPIIAPLPSTETSLLAVCEVEADEGLLVRVSGLDEIGRPQVVNYPLAWEPVTLPIGNPVALWSRIDAISKPPTAGWARMHVTSLAYVQDTLLGEVAPSERQWLFRRIRFSGNATRVTVRFRRRQGRAQSLDHVFFLYSRPAIVEQLRAMRMGDPLSGEGYNPEGAKYHQTQAMLLLQEEQRSRLPASTIKVQNMDSELWAMHTMH